MTVRSRRRLRSSRRHDHNETATIETDRGDIAVEMVIIVPLFIFMIFAVLQLGAGWLAKNALEAAAQDGLRASQTFENVDDAAHASIASNAAFLRNINVTTAPASRADRVRVIVRGDMHGVIPGTTLHISGSASGPIERFRSRGEP